VLSLPPLTAQPLSGSTETDGLYLYSILFPGLVAEAPTMGPVALQPAHSLMGVAAASA